jgi:hypothetical protein
MHKCIVTLVVATLTAFSAPVFAADWYRVLNYNTLITANHNDLVTFMALNSMGAKSAVSALYRNLEARGVLFNIQPDTEVAVVDYYDDGTARIEWGNGSYTGYIARADLGQYID